VTRTTWQEHARIERKIINLDRHDPGPVACSWDECEARACTLYRVRLCEHSPRVSCGQTDQGIGGGHHYWYTFCRERHKQYWLAAAGLMAHDTADRNSGRIYGMLPPGYRLAL